jgi:mannose-1-phosphate guanylyltransferase
MKAMILAAGRGTRVRPLTDTLPKPMIPIIHKPVMEMLVDHLRCHGFTEIMVNTSYLAPQIEGYFRDGQRFGVNMAYSFEGSVEDGEMIDNPVGSAGALQKIQSHSGFFDEDFVVVCGDAVIDLDITELMHFHRKKGAIATVALKQLPRADLVNYGVAVLNEDERILNFQEKPAAGTELSDMANTGIYIFSPKVFEWIPKDAVYDIGGQLLPALAAAGAPIYGTEIPFNWFDIGRLPDFYQVVMQALRGEAPPYSLPGKPLKPNVWIGPNVRINLDQVSITGPVFIGGSASIGDGCTITGPAMIGANAHIEPGTQIFESIILDHTRLSNFGAYHRKVVGPDFCFDPEGTVLDGKLSDISWLFSDARSPEKTLNEDQLLLGQHSLQVARGRQN